MFKFFVALVVVALATFFVLLLLGVISLTISFWKLELIAFIVVVTLFILWLLFRL